MPNIDWTVNLSSIIVIGALLTVIWYSVRRWINGSGKRLDALEEEIRDKVCRTEFDNSCNILRSDIKEVRDEMKSFHNGFIPGGGIYKAFQDEIRAMIVSNQRLLERK